MATAKLERSAAELFLEQALRDGRARRTRLALDKIVLDKGLQSRVKTDPGYIHDLAELIKSGIDLRPVVVFNEEPLDIDRLADGFHRHPAHRKAGMSDIACYQITGGFRDAMLYSVSANLENSKRTSPDDKKKAVRMMLDDPECRTWSAMDIGRRCGLCGSATGKIIKEYFEEKGIPLPDVVRIIRGDGRTEFRPRPIQGAPRSSLPLREVKGSNGRVRYRTTINGKRVWVGKDQHEAQEKARQLALELPRREYGKRSYNATDRPSLQTQAFKSWLSNRSVKFVATGQYEPACGVIFDETLVVMAPAMERNDVLAAIASIYLDRKAGAKRNRTIVACYHDTVYGPQVSQLMELARREPDPIEFMTPMEILADPELNPNGRVDLPEPEDGDGEAGADVTPGSSGSRR